MPDTVILKQSEEGRVEQGGARRWLIVALVFAAIMLNYVDRQIIALLKPTLEAHFGWSDHDYGHMASAFQFASAVSFLGTGWFIDRVGLRLGFALGVGVWSVAGMAHAVVRSVAGFVGARVVLGAAESIGTPAAVKTAAAYFTAAERSTVIGIGNMAPNIGAVATPLLIPPLAVALGWRAAFLISGGLGLVWVALWLLAPAAPRGGAEAALRPARVPWGAMLRDRRQWAVIAAKALSDEVWWFLLFFMPDLFNRHFGMSQAQLGWPVAMVYAMAALGSLSGGWLPSRLIARGMSVNRARKLAMLVSALLILPVPTVLLVASPWAAAAILGLALFAHQGFSTNVFGITTDMFPSALVGTAIGIGGFAGNLSGMAMLEFAGWSLAAGHGYAPMMLLCGFSYLAALGCVQLLVPRIQPIDDQAAAPLIVAH